MSPSRGFAAASSIYRNRPDCFNHPEDEVRISSNAALESGRPRVPEKIKLYRLGSSNYRFDLIAENRAIIGSSELFANRADALTAIDLVKRHSRTNGLFRIFCDYDDKYYFSLETDDGDILINSQGYSSSNAAEEGIRVLKNIAVNGNLVEISQQQP